MDFQTVRKNSKKLNEFIKKSQYNCIEIGNSVQELSSDDLVNKFNENYNSIRVVENHQLYKIIFANFEILVFKEKQFFDEYIGKINCKLELIGQAESFLNSKNIHIKHKNIEFLANNEINLDLQSKIKIIDGNNIVIDGINYLKKDIVKRDYYQELKNFCIKNKINYDLLSQRTEDWFLIRQGRITATQAKCLVSDYGFDKLLSQNIAECLYDQSSFDFLENNAIRYGKEQEELALKHYENSNFTEVLKISFVMHPDLNIGCSPDGLIYDNDCYRAIEVKCPYCPKNHIKTLISQEVPAEYKEQINWQMFVLGMNEITYLSYDNRIKPPAGKDYSIVEIKEKINNRLIIKFIDKYLDYNEKFNEILEKLK